MTNKCATLETQIDPGGLSTTYVFSYVVQDYSSQPAEWERAESTSPAPVGSDNTAHPVSATVCHLEPGTTYYFRAVATNSQSPEGGTDGPTEQFTTEIEAPAIESTFFSERLLGCVTLDATVFDGGSSETTYRFEYITQADYEADREAFGAGTETTPARKGVNRTGLFKEEVCHLAEPRVAYFFRAVATDSQSPPGGTLGPRQPFTTLNAASHELTLTFGDAEPTTATNVEDPYPLSGPTAIAEEHSTHDLYVTDPGNHRVEKFNAKGEFLLMFGKDVNKHGTTEAEQDVCRAGEECQPGAAAPATPSCSLPVFPVTCVEVKDVPAAAFLDPATIAVDNSTGPSAGDVYVSDPATHLVSKFEPSGQPVSGWGDGEGKGQEDGRKLNTGREYSFPPFDAVEDVAVDRAGELFVRDYVTAGRLGLHPDRHLPKTTSTTHPFLDLHSKANRTPSSTDPAYALDPATAELYHDTGSLVYHYPAACEIPFITEGESREEVQFSCEGKPIDAFGAGQLSGAGGPAVEAASNAVLVPDGAADQVDVFSDIRPAVTTQPSPEAGETTLTLAGAVNPETRGQNHGPIAVCFFEWGLSNEYGHTVPCEQPTPYPGEKHVTAKISGLTPITDLPIGAEYHFRLVASNQHGATEEGHDETALTTAAPQIEGVSASHLTSTSAQLDATIKPNGLPTTYRFSYGPTTAYGQTSAEGVIEGAPKQLSQLRKVAIPIEGLQPGATYHFRLLAENSLDQGHPVVSEDHSFEFFPPACPNSAVRQQTGSSYLPDCRAYELVSPQNANATLLYPGGPATGQATDPSRFSFTGNFSSLPGANTIDTGGDLYVATRTDTGWASRYIGLPGSQAGCMGGPPTLGASGGAGDLNPPWLTNPVLTDPSMDRFLDFIDGGAAECFGFFFLESAFQIARTSNAPFLWSADGTLQARLPTDLASLPRAEEALRCYRQGLLEGNSPECSGETTASADLSHLFFSTNKLDFAEGGLTQAPGSAYDNDLASATVKKISVLKDGENIPQDPAYATVQSVRSGAFFTPGGSEEFLRFPAVSEDGSRVLISTATAGTRICNLEKKGHTICPRFTETPIHLYMRVGDAATYQPSESELTHEDVAVSYVGMTPDGAHVYFTSSQQLTSAETDGNTELYMWSAEKAEHGEEALTLISKPNGGADDTTACHPALETSSPGREKHVAPWTEGCGAVPYSGYDYSWQAGGIGGNGLSDSAIAQNGDIYFYSPAQLDGDRGVLGAQNLYLYREGEVRYVLTLAPEPRCGVGIEGALCSQGPIVRIEVSPDGSHMAFLTASRLTPYDNAGHEEMYSYTPPPPTEPSAAGTLLCDSCNPSGAPATAEVFASEDGLFMTDDGRTFFSTSESLVPQDTNEATDVYEYVDGAPHLITPGTGTAPASSPNGQEVPGLIGVSANGTDVYFSTFDTLIPEDHNGQFLKFYDARTDGGFPQPPPSQPCEAAEECHGPGTEAPTLPPAGAAATLTGGNAHPGSHAKHHKKKHKRAKAKHHKRAAHHNRGGKR